MNGTLRLFNIETRRNAAIWFVPIIAIVAWWLLDLEVWTPFLWESTNRLLRNAFIPFAGPAIAGVAAWMAGRNRRRGIEDLLASTPHSATMRRLTLWAATAFWGLLSYILFAMYMMGQTAFQATWGGPAFWPVAIVVLAILAQAAWGFFLGELIPSRFIAPVAGIAALGLQQFPAQYTQALPGGGSMSSWANNLAAHNGHSEWHALLYLGLTGAGLAAIALRERRNVLPAAAFTCALLIAVGSVVMIWGQYPRLNQQIIMTGNGAMLVNQDPVSRNNFGQVMTVPEWNPPEPVCKGSPVTVCTHPAYQPILDQTVMYAAQLADPLLHLPGVPTRIEDGQGVSFSSSEDRSWLSLDRYADMLVADDQTLQHGNLKNPAQIAMRDWLMQRADLPQWIDCDSSPPESSPHHNLGWSTPETCAATERFAALPETQQRAWLQQHYTDLRAGNLTLADLP